MGEILDQTLACLRSHLHGEWGDRSPFDEFNRLLAKNIGLPGFTTNTHADLQLEQITSRKERWTTAALSQLARGHNSPAGVDVPWPIILAEYEGMRVLDGNHRINRWVALRDARDHDVPIHTVVGPVRFIELPSVAL